MKQQIQNLRLWLQEGNRTNWVVFGLLTLMVFGKTLMFDHFAFREWSFEPTFTGVLCKLAAAMLFASFTFLLRDKRWLILLSVVIDTWLIANLIYMRNNHILLDAEAFNMSGNLHGYFWSVLIYIEWWIDLLFYSLTGVFCVIYFFTTQSPRNWRGWLWMVALGLVMFWSSEAMYVVDHHRTDKPVPYDAIPFIREHREPVYGTHFPTTVANTSVLFSPLYITSDYYLMINDIQPDRPLTPHDYAVMQRLDFGSDTATLNGPTMCSTPIVCIHR